MKVYVITEAQKTALLKALELEAVHTPDQFCVTPETRKAQTDAVASMHKRFIYHVIKALEDSP